MGRILAPYGVRGWVKVRPQTEAIDGLLGYRVWWIEQNEGWREYRLVEGRVHGQGLVVHFEGLDDRERAASLAGRPVAVPRSMLPAPESGEYYWCDLIGMTVLNLQHVELGHVEEILATVANDVLVVRGERERLIPFIAPVVERVDTQNSRLVVDWDSDF